MTGEINMSKLDTKPELEEKKKTGTLPNLNLLTMLLKDLSQPSMVTIENILALMFQEMEH